MNKQAFVSRINAMTSAEASNILSRTHEILDALTDERSAEYSAPHGALDTVVLIEEIGEFIAALITEDKIAIMEEAADVMLCLASMEYIYSIPAAINVTYEQPDTKEVVITNLLNAQQIICKALRGRATSGQLEDAHNIITVSVYSSVEAADLIRAMAVKLARIEARLKTNELN